MRKFYARNDKKLQTYTSPSTIPIMVSRHCANMACNESISKMKRPISIINLTNSSNFGEVPDTSDIRIPHRDSFTNFLSPSNMMSDEGVIVDSP